MKNVLFYFLFISLGFGLFYCGSENKEEPVPETPTREETLANYIKFGLSVDQLLEQSENFTVSELLEAGVSVKDLVESKSVDFAELKDLGITISQLYAAGAEINNLYNDGYSFKEIFDGGYPFEEFVNAGFSIKDFIDNEISVHELVSKGVSLSELASAGATVKDVIEEGFTNEQLVIAGIPINKISGTSTNQEDSTFQWIGIGNQVWMAENLDVTIYNDNTPIPLVSNSSEWNNSTTPAYCWYNNDIDNKDKGALYNWYTVNTKKLCPKNWHVPTDADWTKLTDYLGGENVAGGKIKFPDAWQILNPPATGESDFNAIPSGERANGNFMNINGYAYWWTSIQNPSDLILRRSIHYSHNEVFRGESPENTGYSVRCIID